MRISENHKGHHAPMLEDVEIVIALIGMGIFWIAWFIAHDRYHLSNRQIAELVSYLSLVLLAIIGSAVLITTRRSWREKQWPHPPMVMSPKREDRFVTEAQKRGAVVPGYDIHGRAWYWPDSVRVMQGLLLGVARSGQTPLLTHIITW